MPRGPSAQGLELFSEIARGETRLLRSWSWWRVHCHSLFFVVFRCFAVLSCVFRIGEKNQGALVDSRAQVARVSICRGPIVPEGRSRGA